MSIADEGEPVEPAGARHDNGGPGGGTLNDTVRIASVTGVDLALKVAGPGARSYAFVIDWHIRVLLMLVWLVVGIFAAGGLAAINSAPAIPRSYVLWAILPATAVYLLYHPVLEVLMQGRTPGKRIAGVRIVTEQGHIPGTLPLLIRNVLRLLDSLPTCYVIGLITTMVTRDSVRLGDLAAGTLLVYDTAGRDRSAAELARDQVAIARHGFDRIELVRDLLDRWNGLEPAARARISGRLLAELGDPPPTDATEYDLLERLREHVRR